MVDEIGKVLSLVGLFKLIEVLVSVFLANEGNRVAVLYEDHVHQESRHASVTVVEGVDAYESVVECRGDDDGVFAFALLGPVPVDEVAHGRLDLIGSGEVVGLAGRCCYVVRRGLVVANRNYSYNSLSFRSLCLLLIGFFQEDAVEIADEDLI